MLGTQQGRKGNKAVTSINDETEKVQNYFPSSMPQAHAAWLANSARKQLIHLLQHPEWLAAAEETLDIHDDRQWAVKLLLYSVLSLREELIQESTAALAVYQVTYGRGGK